MLIKQQFLLIFFNFFFYTLQSLQRLKKVKKVEEESPKRGLMWIGISNFYYKASLNINIKKLFHVDTRSDVNNLTERSLYF
jgi:hypothetical protein